MRIKSALCRQGALGHHAAVTAPPSRNPRRAIPSVARLLAAPAGAALVARYRREHVVEAMRAVLEELRRRTEDGTPVPADGEVLERVAARLAEAGAIPARAPAAATGSAGN